MDEYDEMAEDVFEQMRGSKKRDIYSTTIDTDYDPTPQNLTEIPQYTEQEILSEDDFDIVYRTPEFAFDESPKKAEQLIGTVLPEEIVVTNNPDKYTDEKMNKYRGIRNMWPGRNPYDNPKKQSIYDKITSKEEQGTGAVYSPVLDEIVMDKNWMKENTFRQNIDGMVHENIHKRQREIEFRTPSPRVKSEPSVELFQQMYDDNIIEKDFSNYLKKIPIGNVPKRKQIMKQRREELKDFRENFPFSEQMAYYGEDNMNKIIRNPQSKTERTLNRMWFQ